MEMGERTQRDTWYMKLKNMPTERLRVGENESRCISSMAKVAVM
jgi:hypothetical protein